MMKKLLTDLAKSRVESNALKHSLLSLERYFMAVKEEECTSWAILIDGFSGSLDQILRSVPLAYFHIGVDWTVYTSGRPKEDSAWGAFVLNITHDQFDRLKKRAGCAGVICTDMTNLDPEFWIEEARQAMNVDVLYFRMFPLSVPEGMLYQTILKELKEKQVESD
jgi:hypothetical protein